MTADTPSEATRPPDQVTLEILRGGQRKELPFRRAVHGDPPEEIANLLHRAAGRDWEHLRLRMDWDDGWTVSFEWTDPDALTLGVLGAALAKRPMRRAPDHRDGDGVRISRQRVGRLEVTVARDTGPPEWTWPRVKVSAGRKNGGAELAVMAGWRRTARHLIVTIGRKAGR